MNDAAIGVERGFVHHLRQGRMREDSLHQVLFGGFQFLTDDVTLDQLGHFRTDHMGAQKLAGFGVEDGLDQALGFTKGNRLAVADEGKFANLDGVASLALASDRPTLATCG